MKRFKTTQSVKIFFYFDTFAFIPIDRMVVTFVVRHRIPQRRKNKIFNIFATFWSDLHCLLLFLNVCLCRLLFWRWFNDTFGLFVKQTLNLMCFSAKQSLLNLCGCMNIQSDRLMTLFVIVFVVFFLLVFPKLEVQFSNYSNKNFAFFVDLWSFTALSNVWILKKSEKTFVSPSFWIWIVFWSLTMLRDHLQKKNNE